MDKRVGNADAAISRIEDGATILLGGFGLCPYSGGGNGSQVAAGGCLDASAGIL